MFLLFTIPNKLMLILCGIFVGAWIECCYTHAIFIGIIMSTDLHFIYLPDKLEPTSSKDYEDEP